jgi:hypothetical protein
MDVKHKIKCDWMKWREESGVYAIRQFQIGISNEVES